jgi:hypothetical protein
MAGSKPGHDDGGSVAGGKEAGGRPDAQIGARPNCSSSDRRTSWAGQHAAETTQGKTNFMNNLSPVARSALACSKICPSFFRKSCFLYAIPPHQRGVSRPSRAWSAGCGGRMGLQRGSFRADEHPDAHGQAVWSWHPGADAKLAMTFCGRRGQERRSPRRARSKP